VGELVKVEDMPEWARHAMQAYLGKDVNLLLPAVPVNAELGFAHKPMVSLVRVSADPRDGDCYKVGSRKNGSEWEDLFALAKPALDRVASAAGINFVTMRVDDRSSRDRCEVECRAAMKNESGAWVVKTYRKELDMRDVEDARRQERAKANERAGKDKKTPEQLEDELRNEMAQYRKHLAARTETGAILRAVRGQLGIRSQWTKGELAKPFVVMRVDYAPDASDPVARRFLMEQGARASEALFGQMGRAREIVGAEVVHEAGRVTVEADDLPVGEEPVEEATPARMMVLAENASETDRQEYIRRGVELLGIEPGEYIKLVEACGYDMKKIAGEIERRANENGGQG